MTEHEMSFPDPETEVRRAHSVLKMLFQRAGRGSIQRVEDALDVGGGLIRKWRLRCRIELRQLYCFLRELDIPPQVFWAWVYGADSSPVAAARQPGARPRDPVVQRAVQRWRTPPAGPSVHLDEEELHRLDRLRDHDPGLAARRAIRALRKAEKGQIPRLLGIYGSARRVQHRIPEAIEALQHSLGFVGRGRDRRLEADLLQRLGVAFAYSGDHQLGLAFAVEAAQNNGLATEVIMHLVRRLLGGKEINLELLDRVGRAIEKGGARRAGRARGGS